MKLGAIVITLLTVAAWASSAVAQPQHHGHHAPTPAQAAADKIGQVSFPISCAPAAQKPFERAVTLLHSFWYLEAVKGFTEVTQIDPQCAIGYWGIAMSNWTQIWSPPPPPALKRGWEAVEKAKAATSKSPKEADFIAAAEAFFKDADKADHRTRALAYGRLMEQAFAKYPNDREVAAFYALSLQAIADPKDKMYAQQQKSAEIAEKIFAAQPDHPGAAHYIIHAYDYPSLAQRGLTAAGRYAQFAPAVPHALHMPSHIYVLLGMWPETVRGNYVAAEAERVRGNPDDHMHAIDYLVYGYLQMAQDADAKRVVDQARAIMSDLAAKNYNSGRPTAHFAMAAVEARFTMERNRWSEAAAIDPRPNRFAHTEAMIYFARAIGAARTGSPARAKADVDRLVELREALVQAKDSYWVEQVEIQRRGAAAWLARAEGRPDEALAMMRSAADLEDSTEKHNITPGPIATARELLGDMLLEMGQPAQAAREYEASLNRAPNRFKTLYGIARASELGGDRDKARTFYSRLVAVASGSDNQRPELQQAKAFLGK
jgi:tetratricopeptide (TPR) repeat protein